MKIITWNVNGLRALLNKGVWDWVKLQAPDYIGLQEIKARPDQLKADQLGEFSDFSVTWNPAERPGYSGVASLHASEPDEITLGFGETRFDVEGRVIQSLFGQVRLFNIYFPNGQRGHERLSYKLDFYVHLLDLCDRLHAEGEEIIITGDFNTAHNEIDLKNPKENKNTSGFMPIEREWVDTYLSHGFKDAYRELYPENEQYTWWTYRYGARRRNIGWRLDYYLVSDSLMGRVQDVIIHDDVLGSDHCPVSLTIDI